VPEDNAIVESQGGRLPVDSAGPATSGPQRRAATGPRGVLRSHGDVLLVISAGGALGSLARWGVGELLPWSGAGFPWATFVENVSGGLALGLLMVFLLDVWPPRRYLRPFLGVGLLGGYTTFSTYMLDTRTLLADGHVAAALGYLFGTLVAGLLAVAAGVVLARSLVRLGERRHRLRRTTRAPDQDGVIDPDIDPDIASDPSTRSIR
jgi:fluoride exporter